MTATACRPTGKGRGGGECKRPNTDEVVWFRTNEISSPCAAVSETLPPPHAHTHTQGDKQREGLIDKWSSEGEAEEAGDDGQARGEMTGNSASEPTA